MKWSVLGLIVMGLVAAGSASMLVGALMTPEKPVTYHDAEINVLVAAADLPPWKTIDENDVTMKTIKVKEAPESYFTSSTQVLGRTLSRRLVEGQLFEKSTFLLGRRPGDDIPEGQRLITLSLSPHASLKGLLRVGSFVDVLVSYRPCREETPKTKTLLNNVQVFAIEETTMTSAEQKQEGNSSKKLQRNDRITLIVSPEQAEVLHSATEYGDVSLVLRRPPVKDTTATMAKAELEAKASEPEPEPIPVNVHVVELLKGNERQLVKFENWSDDSK
jgi:Flp pilus assembly protein CpaB